MGDISSNFIAAVANPTAFSLVSIAGYNSRMAHIHTGYMKPLGSFSLTANDILSFTVPLADATWDNVIKQGWRRDLIWSISSSRYIWAGLCQHRTIPKDTIDGWRCILQS